MDDWYSVLWFVSGMFVGQHMTISWLARTPRKDKNEDRN
jgi:hypothetical protein